MRKILLGLLLATFEAGGLQAADVPAKPIERTQPEYPEECMPQGAELNDEQYVDVLYDVTSEGATHNIRVLRSTNSCLDEVAVAAVREWMFEPRRIDGQPSTQKDVTTRLSFVLEKDEPDPEVDVMLRSALSRIYPARCAKDAREVEYVTVKYDISKIGETQNVRVIESTNSCFNKTAVQFIEGWRYEARDAERKDVEVTLTFQLE